MSDHIGLNCISLQCTGINIYTPSFKMELCNSAIMEKYDRESPCPKAQEFINLLSIEV